MKQGSENKKELPKRLGGDSSKGRVTWYKARQEDQEFDYLGLSTWDRLALAFVFDKSCSAKHKKALSNAFKELYQIPANRPIMDIASQLILDKKVPLLLQATAGTNLALLGEADAVGDAAHDRVIRVAINLKDVKQLKGTLIHELTHIVSNELYGNEYKPYKEGKKREYKKAVKASIPGEVSALTKQEQYAVMEMLQPHCHEIYTKHWENAWKFERVVRIPQLFSTTDPHGQVLHRLYPEDTIKNSLINAVII